MNVEVKGRRLELVQGDITEQRVDVIVNAANSRLAGGGGVDGAIHRVGGPEIMAETNERFLEGCPTGSAVVTGAGQLSAQYVIHAVGPFYSGGSSGEDKLLASAYRASLRLAGEQDCHSIALPSLSTGAYRYPLAEAARIALSTALTHLEEEPLPELIRFVLFSEDILTVFEGELAKLSQEKLS